MLSSSISRKRDRGAGINKESSAAKILTPIAAKRKHTVDRIDNLDTTWIAAALKYHTAPSLGVILSEIGKDIVKSLKSIPEQAEMERQRIKAARALAHSAIDARFDELTESLDFAEGI